MNVLHSAFINKRNSQENALKNIFFVNKRPVLKHLTGGFLEKSNFFTEKIKIENFVLENS